MKHLETVKAGQNVFVNSEKQKQKQLIGRLMIGKALAAKQRQEQKERNAQLVEYRKAREAAEVARSAAKLEIRFQKLEVAEPLSIDGAFVRVVLKVAKVQPDGKFSLVKVFDGKSGTQSVIGNSVHWSRDHTPVILEFPRIGLAHLMSKDSTLKPHLELSLCYRNSFHQSKTIAKALMVFDLTSQCPYHLICPVETNLN